MNSLIDANISCLRQGIACLGDMPADWYTRPCDPVFGSSIGGHFRHNLDHLTALLDGYSQGRVDYDARQRDPSVETEPRAAMDLMERQIGQLKAMDGADLDAEFRVRMDDGGDPSWSRTSLRRELQFVLSHTIHHYALIVSIATRFGQTRFPAGFGIAPSTLTYRAGLST